MALIRGWVNGEIAVNWEVTVLAMADGLELSEASMSVGCPKANAASVLQGFGELSFGAKRVDGGVELAQLILTLAITRDLGGEPPVAQLVGRFSQMGVAGSTPLKEAKEPGTHRFRGEGGIFNGVSKEFVSVHGFSCAKMPCNSPYLGPIVLVPFDELRGEREALANRDLEGGDVIVVVNEVGRNTGFIKVEVLLCVSLHGRLQAIFGVINASTHSCAVSFPGEFTEFDGGDESGDDFL